MMISHRLSLDNIADAARSIPPIFLHTPQFVSEGLSKRFGCELTIKVETVNPIGSFKGRGASYFVQTSTNKGPMVCASAGNFGQALAYACRAESIPVTVFASHHANPLKLTKMRAFGADVRLSGDDFDAAKAAAVRWADETGAYLVVDGLQKEIAEGAGSIAVELLQARTEFDAVLIPLGNGALLTGMARWIKAHAPKTRVIGVSSIHAPAMHDSWRSGGFVETSSADTIADGIAVRIPIPEAVEDMRGIVDDVVLVEESSIRSAMKLLLDEERLLIEPAGAVGLAALLEHPSLRNYGPLTTVLCGSNLTSEQADNSI